MVQKKCSVSVNIQLSFIFALVDIFNPSKKVEPIDLEAHAEDGIVEHGNILRGID